MRFDKDSFLNSLALFEFCFVALYLGIRGMPESKTDATVLAVFVLAGLIAALIQEFAKD